MLLGRNIMTLGLWMPSMYFVIVPAMVLFPKKETSIVTHKDLSILKTSKNCRKENIWNWYKWIQMRRSNRTDTAVVTLIHEPKHGDHDCKSESTYEKVWESDWHQKRLTQRTWKTCLFAIFYHVKVSCLGIYQISVLPSVQDKVMTWPSAPRNQPQQTVDLHKAQDPGNDEETYPTRRKRIIDSKVPDGRGYVSSLEGNTTFSSRIAKLFSRQHETTRQSPLLRNHSNTSARMAA